MQLTFAERFWAAIRDMTSGRLRTFANYRVREAYMKRVGQDYRCQHCGTWSSEVGGIASYWSRGDGVWAIRCKSCHGVSDWLHDGPVAIPVHGYAPPRPGAA